MIQFIKLLTFFLYWKANHSVLIIRPDILSIPLFKFSVREIVSKKKVFYFKFVRCEKHEFSEKFELFT
jgi:hypothetical protein